MAEVIDNRTEGRGWLIPDPQNKLRDDVARIVAGLQMADGDVTGILLDLGQKAPLLHEHGMADIIGLADALSRKADTGHAFAFSDLTDVDISAAANGQVVMKQGEIWIPVALQIGHVAGLENAVNGKLSATAITSSPAKNTLADTDRLVIVNSTGDVISTALFSVLKASLKAATALAAGFMSAADKVKLDGIAAGAGVVPSVVTTTVNGLMAFADKVKLNGIAAGATANSSDAALVARANHTGTQGVATISGLGSLATKNDATLTTDVIGILPVANGGTGATAFPGAPKVTSSVMPVGYSGFMILSSSSIAVGATVSGANVSTPVSGNSGSMNNSGVAQSGTWRNDSGAALVSPGAGNGGGGCQMTRIS